MTSNADMIAYWNEVAGAKWVAGQRQLDRLMAPLTDALLDVAVPRSGERVLDVGCGCGDLALRLAEAVGPTGAIVAVDVSRPMLAHAKAREADLTREGRAAIEWQLADAATTPFASRSDLLASRFGVMFFAEPDAAFRNLRTALVPGGRLAILTWRRRAEVEWMQRPAEWLANVLPMPADATGEPGPFGLADETSTRRMIAAAGFSEVSSEPLDRPLTIGASVEEAYDLLSQTGPAAAMLRDVEDTPRRAALERLREGIAAQAGAGGVVMGAACWIYRARA